MIHRHRLSPESASHRGSALLVTVILVAIAAVSVAQVTRMIMSNARMVDRKADSAKALQACYAGLSLVQHYFNVPSEFPGSSTHTTRVNHPNTGIEQWLFENDLEDGDTDDYTTFKHYIASQQLQILPSDENIELPEIHYNADGEPEDIIISAFIESITITSMSDPRVQGSYGSLDVALLGVVEVKARSAKYGIERTLQAILRGPVNFKLVSPAALLSYDQTYTTGNVKVHWGESWSKGDIDMSSQPNFYNDSTGPTRAVRSEGNLIFGNSGQWQIPLTVQESTTIQDVAAESASSTIRQQFDDRLFQNQTLDFPTYDYAELKALAQLFGEYYSTDASGNIYIDGIEDEAHLISIDTILNNDADAVIDGDRPEAGQLVFIDTIDGNPPAADFSNLTTISVAGSGEGTRFMRGFWFINAHFDVSGIGSSYESLTVDTPARPDDWASTVSWPTTAETTLNVISDGITLIAGNFEVSGQPGFFGSLITLGAITGSGTPNVYYDEDLKNGRLIEALSNIEIFAVRVNPEIPTDELLTP